MLIQKFCLIWTDELAFYHPTIRAKCGPQEATFKKLLMVSVNMVNVTFKMALYDGIISK